MKNIIDIQTRQTAKIEEEKWSSYVSSNTFSNQHSEGEYEEENLSSYVSANSSKSYPTKLSKKRKMAKIKPNRE